MKIGIIIYSYSGNTLSVAEKLKGALLGQGHEVSLERIKAMNDDPQSGKPIQLTETPDMSQFDENILGAPVRAFSLNPVMKAYIGELHDLQSK